jgi:invasion protein IalB
VRWTKNLLMSLAFAQFVAGAAFADDKKPAPVSAQPETTTATYGAWTLRCERRPDVAKGQKICEIAESVVPQKQQNAIARISLGHPLGADKTQVRITAIFPPNIYIPVAPGIKAKEGDTAIPLAWKRCFPGGCFADGTMPPEVLKAWRAIEADTGRLTFTEATGRNLAIQFSLRGFAQALDALEKAKS